MPLSVYHQKYLDQSEEEIQRKADAKEQELSTIFQEISLNTDSDPLRVAVLGCGDKRLVAHHKKVFENVLKRAVEITTFDITIDHLAGENNVFQHDCTLALPNPSYDITYAHVLLKFIEPTKQFALLENSYNALKSGGVAIHIFDQEEIDSGEEQLPGGLWAVPLAQWKEKLNDLGIKYKEVSLKYGPALLLMKD